MATQMVAAHGDNGLELVPASEAVAIPVAPMGPDNLATPASIRYFHLAFGKPVRLTGIRRHANGWIGARWRDDRGEVGFCTVRNAQEARDPLFDSLPAKSRARLVAAVRN